MKTVPLNLRIEEDIKKKLLEKANEEGHSLSSWIRFQLKKLVEKK
jgi:predicted HicB family RNase H-like nuclease